MDFKILKHRYPSNLCQSFNLFSLYELQEQGLHILIHKFQNESSGSTVFILQVTGSNPPSLSVYCLLSLHALLGVVTIDDDRKIDPDDVLFGFKVWQVSIQHINNYITTMYECLYTHNNLFLHYVCQHSYI